MSGKNCGILLILIGLLIVNTGMAEKTWSVTQNGTVLEIAYGRGESYPQYAALYLDSGYFRMNYGLGSEWGTSLVIAPSFWEYGKYHQGAPITHSWASDGDDLLIHFNGQSSNLEFEGDIRILPPARDQIIAEVNLSTSGYAILDSRPGEAFKPMMLSSMHISADEWDAQSAYAGSESFSILDQGWIINPPLATTIFGLVGGSNVWKTNAPSIEVILEDSIPVTGWVTLSHNTSDDNIGFWASSSSVLPYWNYTIVGRIPEADAA